MRSVMPVADNPEESTNTAATMMAGSLEKPDRASLGSRMPVIASASVVSIATRSTRSLLLTNNVSAIARIARNIICCGVIVVILVQKQHVNADQMA